MKIRSLRKPPSPAQPEYWEQVKAEGKKRYILRVGIMRWGGTMLILMTTLDLIRKTGRQFCAEIFLELRVKRDIAGVIQKQVKLDLIISGSRQKCRIEFVSFGRHQCRVLDAMQVLPFGRLGREELAESSAILRRRFFPILLDRIPALAQALLIGIAVLRNDGGDPLRMR